MIAQGLVISKDLFQLINCEKTRKRSVGKASYEEDFIFKTIYDRTVSLYNDIVK